MAPPIVPVAPAPTHTHWGLVFGILVLAVLVYIAGAYYLGMWPFAPLPYAATPTPLITNSVSPTPTSLTATWKTYTDTAGKYSFRYPETLGTQYISPQTWPPVTRITAGTLSCAASARKVIGGNTFCVMNSSQGTAGSVYTTYAYQTAYNNTMVMTLAFTLQYPQCDNYSEPSRTACTQERATFNVDMLAADILFTFTMTP